MLLSPASPRGRFVTKLNSQLSLLVCAGDDDLRAKTAAVAASQARGRCRSRASTACMPATLMWLHWHQQGTRPPSATPQEAPSQFTATARENVGKPVSRPARNEPEHVAIEACSRAVDPDRNVPAVHAEVSLIHDLAAGADATECVDEGRDGQEPRSRTGHSVAFERTVAFSETAWGGSLEQPPTLLLQGVLSHQHDVCIFWPRPENQLLAGSIRLICFYIHVLPF